MMEESRKLVKDTSERLEGAVQDLRELIVSRSFSAEEWNTRSSWSLSRLERNVIPF